MRSSFVAHHAISGTVSWIDAGTGEGLGTQSWGPDTIVDVSGYVYRQVESVMDVLGDRVGRYVFISSHAVYTLDDVGPGSDEDTPLRRSVGARVVPPDQAAVVVVVAAA